MSKQTPSPAPTPTGPAYVVWFVPERKGAKWTRIGVLWPTKTGNGYRLNLEFMPASPGSTLVLPYEARTAEEGEGA